MRRTELEIKRQLQIEAEGFQREKERDFENGFSPSLFFYIIRCVRERERERLCVCVCGGATRECKCVVILCFLFYEKGRRRCAPLDSGWFRWWVKF